MARSVVALAAALFLVRVLGEPWDGGFDPFFPDTASYLRVRDRGPFSPRFWFDERPPTYPLMLWLIGGSGRVVVVIQSVAYVVAWIWLGAVVWQRIASRPVAVVTIVVLGLTAVQARWALWTTQMLTESLSITLAVAGVAAWWQFVAEPLRWRITVATSITAAWMLLRDSNAVTFTVFAVPSLLLAIFLVRRTATDLRRFSVVGLAVLVAVGALLVDRPGRFGPRRDVVPQQRRAAVAGRSGDVVVLRVARDARRRARLGEGRLRRVGRR